MTDQMTLFGPDGTEPEPATDEVRSLRLMITVKAAPNPSQTYGETVCVAGVSVDPNRPGWIRLYPVNFRYLEQDTRFSKVRHRHRRRAEGAGGREPRSWKPRMATLRVEKSLRAWDPRRPHIAPYINTTMCELNAAARGEGVGPSLGLVRAASVEDFVVETHPGWTRDEQTKIDNYVGQLDLFGGEDRTPLEAPRLKGTYHRHCRSEGCRGHKQGNIDWELVAFQRTMRSLGDAELADAIKAKFLGELCAPDRDVAFYVGNQAKRRNVFSVLGVWWARPDRDRP